MSATEATVDLDDTAGLIQADRDGLLRASALAGAQVRATAAAVEEGALDPVADGDRPRTVIWVGGRTAGYRRRVAAVDRAVGRAGGCR